MSRADVKAALHALQGSAGFRQYVNTLESELADVMTRIILPESREIRDELCAEARVYRELLQGITNNTNMR
jgi:hypothetical protein